MKDIVSYVYVFMCVWKQIKEKKVRNMHFNLKEKNKNCETANLAAE